MNNSIERLIITGMIVSDEFMRQIRPLWQSRYLQVPEAKRIASWCTEYYDKYNIVPKEDIQTIFEEKINTQKLSDADAEDIEDVLLDMSDEFERNKFNVPYVLDRAELYIKERDLELYQEKIEQLKDNGEVEEASKLAAQYTAPSRQLTNNIDLSDEETVNEQIDAAFADSGKPLFKFAGAYGEMINEHLIRGGFVAFFGPEKIGKTFTLLELAMKASRQGCNVAFFQAGDMTQSQQLMRICINRARKSNLEKYTGEQYIPVKDCIHNQMDTCNKTNVRECDFGVFDGEGIDDPRKEVTKQMLIDKYNEEPDYRPCHNCLEYKTHPWGTAWITKKDLGDPLTAKEAKKVIKKFFVEKKRRFRISTHPTYTLTIKEAESVLDKWEKEDGFVADFIIFDYADIMVAAQSKEFRHQQNEIWMGMRALSQKKHALVTTVSQTDAKAYEQDTLTRKNFSEDKRKFAHVTALLGLNQDQKGREREIGITRVNQLVLREGEYNSLKQVTLLQSLKQGIPILTSYW